MFKSNIVIFVLGTGYGRSSSIIILQTLGLNPLVDYTLCVSLITVLHNCRFDATFRNKQEQLKSSVTFS